MTLIKHSLGAIIALAPMTAAAEELRPGNNTFGFGVGMTFPSDGMQLNTMAWRLRLNNKLTIEPMFGYNQTESSSAVSSAVVDDDGEESTEIVTTVAGTSTLDGSLNVRYNLLERGPTDFYLLGGVGYAQYSTDTSVEGSEELLEERGSILAVSVGAGLEGFVAPKWSAGIDLFTPVYTMVNGTTTGGDEDKEESGSAISVDPTFRLMLTHYF